MPVAPQNENALEIVKKNGIHYLSGRLDEFADFEPLKVEAPPLKLNMGKLTSINSVGVRKFLAFTLAWSPKKFEFFECTPEFIGNVNVIPQMLGQPADAAQIKSFYVPFSCETCKRVENVLFDRAKLKVDHGDVQIQAKKCSRCGNQLELDVEKHEYFMFLGGAA